MRDQQEPDFSVEELEKRLACCDLLPPPGDEVARETLTFALRLLTENKALMRERDALRAAVRLNDKVIERVGTLHEQSRTLCDRLAGALEFYAAGPETGPGQKARAALAEYDKATTHPAEENDDA